MLTGYKNEILLLHIIKNESGSFSIIETNLEQNKKQSGVWAMWAKDVFNTDICLEVGQSTDIWGELDYDLSYLTKNYENESKNKRYSARRLFEFNKKFDVCECDSNRTCAKYRNIASNYYDIRVYLIGNLNETKEERESVELKYAVDNNALYWNACCKQRKEAKDYYERKTIQL